MSQCFWCFLLFLWMLNFERGITLTYLQHIFMAFCLFIPSDWRIPVELGIFPGNIHKLSFTTSSWKKVITWKYTGMVYFFTLEEQIHLYFKQIFFFKLLKKIWLWAYLWIFCIVWSCVLALSIFVFPYKHLVPACCQQTCLLGMMG